MVINAFAVVSTLIFAASAAVTVYSCASMSHMGMPMPGGWTMSMAWMRMPDQSWRGAAASFVGMWIVMMIAMMLPALLPTLRRFRESVGTTVDARRDQLTAIVAGGYYLVWALCGLIVYPIGVSLAELEMRYAMLARAVPAATVVVVLLAVAFQLSTWKARHLAACCSATANGQDSHGAAGDKIGARDAWRFGVRLGLHCSFCCANLMVILLVLGIMDLRVMAVVTAAITLERLACSPRSGNLTVFP